MLNYIVYNMVSLLIKRHYRSNPDIIERNICASALCYICSGLIILGVYYLGSTVVNYGKYIFISPPFN